MALRSPRDVLSHWNHLIEAFSISPQEFYTSVEAAIARREIPNLEIARVEWREGGLLTARREYLRIGRGRLAFDICAAPFGTGFFFSWWLTEMSARWAPLLGCAGIVALFIYPFFWIAALGFLRGIVVAIITFPIVAILVALALRKIPVMWEDEILGIPLVGQIYEFLFRPTTYYKVDTALMFQSSVHAAVLEVIDGLVEAHGLRALTEGERKPILSGLGLP